MALLDDGLEYLTGNDIIMNGTKKRKYSNTLPITYLNMSGCYRVTDEGLLCLGHMSIEMIDIRYCLGITYKGITYLKSLPLQYITN